MTTRIFRLNETHYYLLMNLVHMRNRCLAEKITYAIFQGEKMPKEYALNYFASLASIDEPSFEELSGQTLKVMFSSLQEMFTAIDNQHNARKLASL